VSHNLIREFEISLYEFTPGVTMPCSAFLSSLAQLIESLEYLGEAYELWILVIGHVTNSKIQRAFQGSSDHRVHASITHLFPASRLAGRISSEW